MWNLDDELIDKIGSTFASNAEIAALIIRDDQQRVVFHQEKPGGKLVKREVVIEHNGQKVGSVEIGLNLNVYEERNRQLLLSSIATMLLLIVVLLGFTRWLLSRLLRRPIDAFVGATSDMVAGKYGQIELPQTYVEFAPILSGFKSMSDAVAMREASLRQSNEQLSAEIDERKRAEEALLASNRLIDSIIENIPDMIFLKRASDLRFEVFNRAGERLLGMSRDALVGKNDFDLFSREQAEFFTSNDRAVLEQGILLDISEETIDTPQGTRILHTKKLPLNDAQGNPQFLLGISEDITERKQAEESSRVSQSRFGIIFNQAPLGIALIDSFTGKIDEANHKFAEIVGRSIDEMTSIDWMSITHPDDVQTDLDNMAMLNSGKISGFRMDKRYLRPDGSYVWINMTIAPLKGEASISPHHLCMIDDITERKQLEEERRRYKDHLEEKVQQRTTDLVLARNAAEAANKAKSVFLASMSHELRTPLNAILGFSSLMRRDLQLPEGHRNNLDIINRSGEHLLGLINDVLEMSKIEAGRVQLENVPFDLGGMLRDVTDMMQVRAEEKGLQLLVDQSSYFPRFILGDEARLRQVLINLVGNAVKFTQQGGVTLRLGTKKDAIAHLLIEVEDSGSGIAPADQQRIFEPFVQLGEQGGSKGTGLGLTITRQFVQLMGGSIVLESQPGKGSLFRVELPLSEVLDGDITGSKEPEKGTVMGLAPNQPEYRILIVEDQHDNQLLLGNLMQSAGFQVKVAENGELGVQLFQSWHPHLIWMDRRMPVMDGVTATRRIRELPFGQEVKIVAVTASAFAEQREEMLGAGMDDFVRKPYRFNEIYDCMAKHLGVKYIYEGVAEPEEATMSLTPELMSGLPRDLRRELHDALESLEGERIAAAIGKVAVLDSKLHKTLLHLAGNFDYPAILNLLQID